LNPAAEHEKTGFGTESGLAGADADPGPRTSQEYASP